MKADTPHPFIDEVLRHVDRLSRLARLLARDRDSAEDLVQETLLRALEKADQLRSEESCGAWLFAILRSVHRTELRRCRSRPAAAEAGSMSAGALHPAPATPYVLVERHLTLQVLERVMNALPPVYREVVRLVAVEELTYEEIAALLGCSVGTVKSRLWRARDRMKSRLAREGIIAAPAGKAERCA